MKILHILQKPQMRGAEIFACQLSNHLLDAGHEVNIICVQTGAATLPFKGKLVSLGRPLNNRFTDWSGWKMLAHYIRDFNPDVVQANAGDTLKYAVLSKFFFSWGAPIVFRNASVISRYIKSPMVKVWNAWLFRRVDYIISVSEQSCQDFVLLFPFMKNRIRVVPIGIDLMPLPEQEPTTERYMVHVGGFTFEKNHVRLLHIFKRIRAKRPELVLWLVGDGPLRSAVEQQVREMELVDAVRFLGFRSDVLTLIQQAQLLVLPSIIEGLPGVILEAMYCKTPVVAYDVGGISEVVKNNETGRLVQAGDEAGFVQAVCDVLDTNGRTITNRAYELVLCEFDNKVVAERFVEVYEGVVGIR